MLQPVSKSNLSPCVLYSNLHLRTRTDHVEVEEAIRRANDGDGGGWHAACAHGHYNTRCTPDGERSSVAGMGMPMPKA